MVKFCVGLAIFKKVTNKQYMSHENHVKILFPFSKNGENEVESVWAIQETKNTFIIDNIPFYVSLLALGDLVEGKNIEKNIYQYTKHVEHSKHSTVRVCVFNENEVAGIRKELQEMGVNSELSDNPQLLALDIPPEIDIQKIIQFLTNYSEFLDYEEACVWY